jgi:hypothetical protein
MSVSYITPSQTNYLVGTGINTPAAWMVNTLNATTPNLIIPVLADQWTQLSPVLAWFTRAGKLMQNVPQLTYGLSTAEDPSGGSYYGAQLLAPQIVDNVQPATQVWRPIAQPVAISITDVLLNANVSGAVDLVTSKLRIMAASLLAKMSRALYHVAPQNTALDIDDINSWVGSTTNTIAGISRSSNTFWAPQSPISVSAVLSTTKLNQGYWGCTNGFDEPDTCLIHNTQYSNFAQQFFAQIRMNDSFPNKDSVQVGFAYKVMFNKATFIVDLNIPQSGGTYPKAFLLNSRYLQPAFHPNDYFTMDPFIKPSNQRVISSALYVTWQFVDFRPQSSVALTALT